MVELHVGTIMHAIAYGLACDEDREDRYSRILIEVSI